jgi:hypothetical protein
MNEPATYSKRECKCNLNSLTPEVILKKKNSRGREQEAREQGATFSLIKAS